VISRGDGEASRKSQYHKPAPLYSIKTMAESAPGHEYTGSGKGTDKEKDVNPDKGWLLHICHPEDIGLTSVSQNARLSQSHLWSKGLCLSVKAGIICLTA
jgi:hypothetical protein